jgi:hypothetical protein
MIAAGRKLEEDLSKLGSDKCPRKQRSCPEKPRPGIAENFAPRCTHSFLPSTLEAIVTAVVSIDTEHAIMKTSS